MTVGAPRRRRAPYGDEGAILIMSLFVMIVGLLLIGALTYAVSNDLQNSRSFATGRNLEYAESSAVSQAIQTIRYAPLLGTGQTLNASPPSYCWGSGPTSTLSNVDGVTAISVWCSTAWTPTSTNTRTVTLSACLSTVSATACSASPSLRAVATFDDYPPKVSSFTNGICDVYCGSSMTVQTWDWNATVPTISSLATKTGPVTGGTSITVTGSGFVSGSTATFVEETGGTPTASNVVVTATSVTYTSATSLTVVTPAIVDGSTYFLEVVTPSGTTSQTSSAIFTFQPTIPTVTATSTTTGTTAGGSSLTITGTGFTTGAVVTLTEETGGTPVSPAVTATGNDLDVVSATSITVVTPAVTASGAYFITVSTTGGTSSYSTKYVITLSGLVPTVSSVTPATGTHNGGTTITIFGTGFVTGSTVTLVPTSGYGGFGTLNATTVTVASGTTITCVTPAGTDNQSYYVHVTNPTGTSSNQVTYTYT